MKVPEHALFVTMHTLLLKYAFPNAKCICKQNKVGKPYDTEIMVYVGSSI